MNMKTNFKALAGWVSLLGLTLFLSSCEKSGGSVSRQIRFSAVSRAEAAAGTRTAYSGAIIPVTEGGTSKKYERIDWLDGDNILICSDVAKTPSNQSSSEYSISDVSESSDYLKSVAKVEPVDEQGLQWGDGAGPYRFMGVYPSSPATISTAGVVTGMSIPGAQNVDPNKTKETQENGNVTNVTFTPDMSYAWMLADAPGVSEGGNVDMQFYPAFTAFEFTIQCQEAEMISIQSFQLSSASKDIWGPFSANLAANGGSSFTPPTSGENKSITVNFSGNCAVVTNTKSVTFTIFALPDVIDHVLDDLSITVTAAKESMAANNIYTRTLALKQGDDFIEFEPGKKHRIFGLAMPNGDYRFILESSVADWEAGTEFGYETPSPARILCYDPTYRRFDSADFTADPVVERTTSYDDDPLTWTGSSIEVSYGYKNQNGEIVILDDDALKTDRSGQFAAYRAAFSPVIGLCCKSYNGAVLRLVLDNPAFKFIQYDDQNGNGAVHGISDAIDITGNWTYFSVVPVEQFSKDVTSAQRVCKVSLLSVAAGTFHEMAFNISGNGGYLNDQDVINYYRMPGESDKELKFFYVGPAEFATVGDLRNADGTQN